MNTMNLAVLPFVLVGFVAAVIYLGMLLRVNWRSTPAGKSQVLLALVAAITMGLAFFRFAGLELDDWVRVVVYAAIDVALIGLVAGFAAARRQGRAIRRRRQEREEIRR